MAKIAQLVEGNYNILDNIPVINQDLTASGFTPVANTYYRHIGATTDTFTQGVIYLYDTAYHKLGESGGTTLNRYELSISTSSMGSYLKLLYKIKSQAKGRIFFGKIYDSSATVVEYNLYYIDPTRLKLFEVNSYTDLLVITGYYYEGSIRKSPHVQLKVDNTITGGGSSNWNDTIKVVYFNDTEITI